MVEELTTAREPISLLVLAGGEFGRTVAHRLRTAYAVSTVDCDRGTHASVWPTEDVIVIASDRESPHLDAAVDQMAHAWRVPWFGVHAGATELRCGPVVVPGATACHQCYTRRRTQHREPADAAGAPPDTPAVRQPAHHVGIAVALALQSIDDVRRKAPDGGFVRRFDQVTGMTSRSVVVPTDRCPRCRDRGAVRRTEVRDALAAMPVSGAGHERMARA